MDNDVRNCFYIFVFGRRHEVEPVNRVPGERIGGRAVVVIEFEGDAVKQGQTLAVVVLVKTSFDIVAPVDGIIEKILVAKEDTFKRGQALARLKASN